jgi:hypothetical protein
MRIAGKWLLVGALPPCALLLGIADRHPDRILDVDSLFSTCMAALCVALACFWYWLDARERNYRRSWGLGIAMVLVTCIALPWYLIRSRSGARRVLTLAKAVGLFVLCGVVYRLASTLGTGA